MTVNDFKAFAIGKEANVLSQNEYEDLEAINDGFHSGIARSEQLNKVWRQASTIAAVVAQFMADKSGDNVVDDGDLEKLRTTLTKALLNNSTSQLDGRYLKSASNLSDVVNAATARVNLGLKGAALQDVGTVSGTVAAGNDSRIVNAAQRGNNLSDLTDKAIARTNLGLGTAALANAQTSKDDNTVGRVVLTGNTIALRTNRYNSNLVDSDFNEAPQNSVSFVYGGASNGPGTTGSVLDFSGLNGGYNVQICGSYSDGGKYLKFRTRNGDSKVWGGWHSIYHTGNKPTASDIGALSLTGGTMSGEISGVYKGSIAFADQYNTKAAFYEDYSTLAYSEYHPVIKQRARTAGSAWAFSMGTLVTGTALSWRLHMRGSGGHEVMHEWNTAGDYKCHNQVIPSNYSNFDARYYTKAQSDAGYMPKVSAYTKSESDARYVQGIRVSATATRNFTPGGGWSPNDSAFVTAISMVGGMSNTGSLLVRYIQRNINGVWANVVA